MSEIEEALIIVGIYLFFMSGLAIPLLIAYFSRRIYKLIKRLEYVTEIEEERTKYHD